MAFSVSPHSAGVDDERLVAVILGEAGRGVHERITGCLCGRSSCFLPSFRSMHSEGAGTKKLYSLLVHFSPSE